MKGFDTGGGAVKPGTVFTVPLDPEVPLLTSQIHRDMMYYARRSIIRRPKNAIPNVLKGTAKTTEKEERETA